MSTKNCRAQGGQSLDAAGSIDLAGSGSNPNHSTTGDHRGAPGENLWKHRRPPRTDMTEEEELWLEDVYFSWMEYHEDVGRWMKWDAEVRRKERWLDHEIEALLAECGRSAS